LNMLLSFCQFLLIVVTAPLFVAIIHKTKQRIRGQKGISLFFFYRTINKYLKKEVVVSNTASFISFLVPYVIASIYLMLIACLPAFYIEPLLGKLSDIIFIVYLSALATFFLTLYALDQGSSFGGIGASREWLLSVLSEPTLVFVLVTLAIQAKSAKLETIFLQTTRTSIYLTVPTILILGALVIIMLAESSRVPFDNPETHLELTMSHEACILEASGKHLALFEVAAYLKLVFYMSLLCMIVWPYTAGGLETLFSAIAFYIAKMLFFCFLIAGIEIANPKMRLFRLPIPLSVGFVMSLLAMILTIKGT